MQHKRIISIVVLGATLIGIAVLFSEGQQQTNMKNIVPVGTPILTVTGETCDVLDSEKFTFSQKNTFNECEVRQHSNVFNGKTIRISAKYGFMIHGSYLSSENCALSRSIDEAISIGFSNEKDWEYIQSLKTLPVEITAVGKFSVSKPSHRTDTIYDRTPYHFAILCLEKASVPAVK